MVQVRAIHLVSITKHINNKKGVNINLISTHFSGHTLFTSINGAVTECGFTAF